MRCDVDWFCVISVLGSGARKPHAALYARAHCRIDSIGVVVHAPSLRRARARQVLRPLDEEQEELNRERAALLARLDAFQARRRPVTHEPAGCDEQPHAPPVAEVRRRELPRSALHPVTRLYRP